VGQVLAALVALAIFAAFFFLLRAISGRIGPRRFWRIGIWIYVPLLGALIVASAVTGAWFTVIGYVITGSIATYYAQRWLRTPKE
jgi:hypothetical protein